MAFLLLVASMTVSVSRIPIPLVQAHPAQLYLEVLGDFICLSAVDLPDA